MDRNKSFLSQCLNMTISAQIYSHKLTIQYQSDSLYTVHITIPICTVQCTQCTAYTRVQYMYSANISVSSMRLDEAIVSLENWKILALRKSNIFGEFYRFLSLATSLPLIFSSFWFFSPASLLNINSQVLFISPR